MADVVPVAIRFTSTAVAPTGTPLPLPFRSTVRGVDATNGVFGPIPVGG